MPTLTPLRGLVIGGTRSGCGKTTLTLALLAALGRRGHSVQACKIGPDFIDPSHHAALTGLPSYNIDAWMGENHTHRVLARMLHNTPADTLIVEGVMGLFDGPGAIHTDDSLCSPGSTAHAARMLGLPVVLAVDARGMGQSAAALAAGFVRARTDIIFAGIVYTHTGGAQHAALLREGHAALLGAENIPLLGIMPREGAPCLPARHLGLLLAHECGWDAAAHAALADWCEEHMNIDAVYARCAFVSPAPQASAPIPHPHMRVGVAHDAAFCFCYPDMVQVLAEMGAQTVYFSPLCDAALPEGCDALYIPGGYPELHAPALAANAPLRHAVRDFANKGGHIYAECGGYMYLMRALHTDNAAYRMCGCLPLECRMEPTRVALGYRSMTLVNAGATARGHEFHYARLLGEQPLPPLWHVGDRLGHALPDEGVRCGNIAASWIHLYPEGARTVLPHLLPGLRHA